MKYIVMRKACIMEDQRQETFIAVYHDKAEAAKWIKDQKGEYFGPSDYYIATSEGKP